MASLSNVAYKNGSWMRYAIWAVGAVCIAVLLYYFFYVMNHQDVVASVPEGYRFAITDEYAENSRIRTTYYVYDGRIFVEDENRNNGGNDRLVMVYEGFNTDSLVLDEDDTIEICELGACYERPKVLAAIKNLLSHKIGREYIRL